MRGYLEAMAISEEIIQLHEEREKEKDAAFEITLTDTQYTVNFFNWQDSEPHSAGEELTLGEEMKEHITVNGLVMNHKRSSVARSNSKKHVCVTRSSITANGDVLIKDVKELIDPIDETKCSMMRQELTVENKTLGKKHTVKRFFLPIDM